MQVLHIADPDCPETKTGYVNTPPAGLLCAADHPAQEVRWLWQDRIPFGKVTLLAGDPGLGKSLLAIDFAARISTGTPFPTTHAPSGGTPGASSNGRVDSALTHNPPQPTACDSLPPAPCSLLPSSVLILSSSDDYHDTIRPRLDAAGADPARIFYLPAIRDLRHDFATLRDAVESIPDCRLIILDPINAYVGPSDAHFHSVVRRVLEPLAQLAAEKSLAILAITHLNKSGGDAIQRAAGSMGFVAAARTIWTLVRDPNDPTRTLLLPLKNNLAPTACGLAFQITSHSAPTSDPNACGLAKRNGPYLSSAAPRLIWDPTPVTISPREALRPAATPKPPRRPTDREEAANFLREALADGPRPANELIDAGSEHGFHRRTIQRAFHDLAGHTAKRGWTAGWWWSIGEYALDVPPEFENLAPNAAPQVTYAHDVTFQNKLDQALQETLAAYPQPTAELRTPTEARSPSDNLSPSVSQSPSPTPPPRPNPSPSRSVSPSRTSPIKPPSLEQSLAYFTHKMNGHANKPKPK